MQGLGANPIDLAHGWTLTRPGTYLLWVGLLSLALRLVSSSLKAIDTFRRPDDPQDIPPFPRRFWENFRGYGAFPADNNDYWHPFILGSIELAALPVLMATGFWPAVGAWVGFKVLGNWRVWTERRCPYNRFLICTALMLIFAAGVLLPLVARVP